MVETLVGVASGARVSMLQGEFAILDKEVLGLPILDSVEAAV